MKRVTGIILKSLAGLILLILVLLFTIPVLFKEKIRIKVEQVINESVNAKVRFDGYKLSFFRNFPNLSFGLNNLSVVGIDKFAGDTLAGFKSFDLVFNLASIFKSSGYEVKSIIIDKAVVNAIVLKDGSANWDISRDTTEAVSSTDESGSSAMKIQLKNVSLTNSSISYTDNEASMSANLENINFNLKGDMTVSQTDLQMAFKIGSTTFIMDGMKYLNKSEVDSKIDLKADLDKMKFTLRENYLSVNDLRLNFSGMIEMPDDAIVTDLQFDTENTSFKSLLSLVPAVYLADYKNLTTSGNFSLKGSAKGRYSDADSTLPDITMDISVSDAMVSYPELPDRINNININSSLFVDGKDLDKTSVDISKFHFELAGNPFDMTFHLRTPMSDPDFKGSMDGKIDLKALSNALPLDSISLSGIINMSVRMAGRLSMLEKEQYDKFQASGDMTISGMLVGMTGYPEVKINEADFTFSPAFAALTKSSLNIGGKSDFKLSGRLENYIPYMFKDETIRGNLSLNSTMIDASEILSKMATDTTAVEDTTALTVIKVPKNIDFDFNALIDNFSYDKIKAQNLKGHITVRDGILSIRDAGMKTLGGSISMNADYDTRDSLNPVMRTDFSMTDISIKDAFTSFNTIQKFAPAAKGIDGKMNVQMAYESQLASDMMPVVQTINGSGKLHSDAVTLVESATFDKMKEVLKLGDNYTNTFKDLNVSFKIANGRIFVSPFDTKVGNIKMNISGDQGLDQTLNYLVKTEIPRSDLGGSVNSLIDNISSQAASFGIAFKPADVLKINVKVTGVFGKPVVMPVFGSGTSENTGTVKETVKQTVSETVDKGKEQLRKEAEYQGDKLIQEAEARGQQLRDEAARAAENLKKEADVQAQRLVDESASKGAIAKLAAQKSADAIRKEADKKGTQLVQEADARAKMLVEEAKAKKEEMVSKI